MQQIIIIIIPKAWTFSCPQSSFSKKSCKTLSCETIRLEYTWKELVKCWPISAKAVKAVWNLVTSWLFILTTANISQVIPHHAQQMSTKAHTQLFLLYFIHLFIFNLFCFSIIYLLYKSIQINLLLGTVLLLLSTVSVSSVWLWKYRVG